MNRINLIGMNLIRTKNYNNAIRRIAATRDSVTWGKKIWGKKVKEAVNANLGTIHALIFSAVLIACSVALGCSSDKPKPVSSNNQIPVTPTPSPIATTPAPVLQADAKPVPKKVVRKKPATMNYTDKTYGVTFEYPRRYAIETGDAAAELLLSSPVPMNFIQPGGVALAAVELPETGFANTDFSSAFFNVNVHKALSADQCSEFAVPQPKSSEANATSSTQTANAAETKPAASTSPASSEAQTVQPAVSQSGSAQPKSEETKSEQAATEQSKPAQTSIAKASNEATTSVVSSPEAQGSKVMLSDMELRGTEAVSGEGTRQSDSKYFHVFQNGACYEFALNVTTVASEDRMTKHVDRDKVFSQLEKIMATVKIDTANLTQSAPEVTAEKAVTAAPTPAQ
jgi:hypothetical protein